MQIEPSTKIMGILFFLAVISYFIYEIIYSYIVAKKKNSALLAGTSYITVKIFGSDLSFFI